MGFSEIFLFFEACQHTGGSDDGGYPGNNQEYRGRDVIVIFSGGLLHVGGDGSSEMVNVWQMD